MSGHPVHDAPEPEPLTLAWRLARIALGDENMAEARKAGLRGDPHQAYMSILAAQAHYMAANIRAPRELQPRPDVNHYDPTCRTCVSGEPHRHGTPSPPRMGGDVVINQTQDARPLREPIVFRGPPIQFGA